MAMRPLLAALLVLSVAALAGSVTADAGPGRLYVTVLRTNFSAYPASSANYINATFKMLKNLNATAKLLYPNLAPDASMKFSRVPGLTAMVTVSLIDSTGSYIKQLITNITNINVAVFVRDAELTNSDARVLIQTDGPNNLPAGGHSYSCGVAGPYAVGILCPASTKTRPPRPPPTPKSPPKPPSPPAPPAPLAKSPRRHRVLSAKQH